MIKHITSIEEFREIEKTPEFIKAMTEYSENIQKKFKEDFKNINIPEQLRKLKEKQLLENIQK